LGIGEALVTVLNEKGIPTPLAATMLRAPQSRMDILSEQEIAAVIGQSRLVPKYARDIDRESAYEILQDKIDAFEEAEKQEQLRKEQEKARKELEKARQRRSKGTATRRRSKPKEDETVLEEIMDSQVGRTVARELTRGLLGVLGLGGRSRSRKKRKKPSWW